MGAAGKTAPGPPGQPLLGHLIPFRRDVLGLLFEGRRRYGDVVRFRLGPLIVHLVSHPDHIRQVLVTGQHRYDKATRSGARIRGVTGEGLLTSNDDSWLRQRRLMQPAFSPQRLAPFVELMVAGTTAMLERWQAPAARGTSLDVASEMMRLTCTIVTRALLGADVRGEIDAVEQAATTVIEHTYQRLQRIIDLPPWVPTPANLRFRRAMRTLDGIVYRIIAERQAQPAGTDLLSLLVHGRDAETGRGMSPEQLRNETITLLLAGHETTANALTWTWYLLSKYPEAARRSRAEVDAVLGSRPPGADDLNRLPYTTAVIQEAMRLYPPIWAMERRAREEDEIGGFHIPRGSTVVVSPAVTHRHPDFWDNPEGFDPERFSPERSAGRPAHAYIPFGLGQRLCIGNALAMMEARVILALVLRAYRLDLVPGFVVEPKPGITLRARHGLLMTLHRPSP